MECKHPSVHWCLSHLPCTSCTIFSVFASRALDGVDYLCHSPRRFCTPYGRVFLQESSPAAGLNLWPTTWEDDFALQMDVFFSSQKILVPAVGWEQSGLCYTLTPGGNAVLCLNPPSQEVYIAPDSSAPPSPVALGLQHPATDARHYSSASCIWEWLITQTDSSWSDRIMNSWIVYLDHPGTIGL